MHWHFSRRAVASVAFVPLLLAPASATAQIQLGPRPFYLVEAMEGGELKDRLRQCGDGPFQRSLFSIAHRGAPLQFPEHTKESYEAAVRMGAGIVECDVTFTKDRELVCRHSQCDLHTTTNILALPELASKCSSPPDFESDRPFENVRCCTSDLTLAELRRLCGKMDASDPAAKTLEAYLGATPNFRTDLYSACGTLMTHAESIELFRNLGVGMTPELKAPSVPMPFEGTYTQEAYAQQMIDEYKRAGVSPSRVWPQSFSLDDVLYWIEHEPAFGRQAVFLDGRVDDASFDRSEAALTADMRSLASRGVSIVAPPIWALLALDADGAIVPSDYGRAARTAGLDIITWSLERSGLLRDAKGPPPTYFYQTVTSALDDEGDVLEVLDVLARDVGVIGVFSDWPATVTYYASCMGIGLE